VAPGLTYASTASRFVAYVIDGIILGIVASIVAGIFSGGNFTSIDPATGNFSNNQMAAVTPIYSIVTTILGAAYFILSWSGGRRATLGQRVLQIQVGNAPDGRALTTEQAVRRWLGLGFFLGLFGLVPALGVLAGLLQLLWTIVLLITTATSPTKQGVHDRFANSVVVRPIGASNGLVTACLILIVLLFVLSILAVVGLFFIASQTSSILSQVGN
jgi:uncharacterized RDD family membrane protein YckC